MQGNGSEESQARKPGPCMVVSIEKIRNEIRTIWRRKMPGHDLIRGSLNLDGYRVLLLNEYPDQYSNGMVDRGSYCCCDAPAATTAGSVHKPVG